MIQEYRVILERSNWFILFLPLFSPHLLFFILFLFFPFPSLLFLSFSNNSLQNKVCCAVPLLDMKRYHKLLAGNSWMAEYGDPDTEVRNARIWMWQQYQGLWRWKAIKGQILLHRIIDDLCYTYHFYILLIYLFTCFFIYSFIYY